jgi:TetR/AcrR family transcriptional regulator, transcriptional repressor for nem operon
MVRPKSFDEEAVLDQALQLFWERGYEATSLSDLEAHLGLGRQSLYNTFGDKHELFLKALQRYRQHIGEAALSGLNAPDAGLEAIRDFFRWSVDFLTAPGPRRGCMVVNTIAELGPQDPDALLHCTHARDALERSFRRALTGAKARGEVSRSLDVEATATLLTSQNYGLVPMAKTGASARDLHAAVEALLSRLK